MSWHLVGDCLPYISGSSSRIRGVFFAPERPFKCEQNAPLIMKCGALVVVLLPYYFPHLQSTVFG